MKVIIPVAGIGTRLRPYTLKKAKPLVPVAGKPVLGHILDRIQKAGIKDIVFVVGWLGEQIKDYVEKNYEFNASYITQPEPKGQAHAIWTAKEFIDEPVLIWFVDTLSDADIESVKKQGSNMVFVKEVDDPRRFGVVVTDENKHVERFVEKPEKPESNLVNIGLYYIRDYKLMLDCIDELITKNIQTKGEFYLVDAFSLMISKGARFETKNVSVWQDWKA